MNLAHDRQHFDCLQVSSRRQLLISWYATSHFKKFKKKWPLKVMKRCWHRLNSIINKNACIKLRRTPFKHAVFPIRKAKRQIRLRWPFKYIVHTSGNRSFYFWKTANNNKCWKSLRNSFIFFCTWFNRRKWRISHKLAELLGRFLLRKI